MTVRNLFLASVAVASLCLGQGAAPAGKAATKSGAYNPPRQPDGHPDLSGYWSNNTATPFERPVALGTDRKSTRLNSSH